MKDSDLDPAKSFLAQLRSGHPVKLGDVIDEKPVRCYIFGDDNESIPVYYLEGEDEPRRVEP